MVFMVLLVPSGRTRDPLVLASSGRQSGSQHQHPQQLVGILVVKFPRESHCKGKLLWSTVQERLRLQIEIWWIPVEIWFNFLFSKCWKELWNYAAFFVDWSFWLCIDPRKKIQMTLPLHTYYDPASYSMGMQHMGTYSGIQANLAGADQFPETLPLDWS